MAFRYITWKTIIDHAFSYIVYGKCMVYHGLPVSKSQSILPWFPCFKTPWITMISMVYHGILPWFIMIYFNRLFSMVYLFQNRMLYTI